VTSFLDKYPNFEAMDNPKNGMSGKRKREEERADDIEAQRKRIRQLVTIDDEGVCTLLQLCLQSIW